MDIHSLMKNAMVQKGEVTDELRKHGLKLCRDWIGGVWDQLPEEEFHMKPLCEGLYSTRSKPLISEKRLGPRLYGMDPHSRLEELLPSKPLVTQQLSKPTFSRMIAKKLAQVHKLEMPLCKKPDFMITQLDICLQKMKEHLKQTPSPDDKHFIEKFRSYNLERELELMKTTMTNYGSEVVFCHNDYHKANILYNENQDVEDDNSLTAIDYEFSAYNYRGYDIGRHFSEWAWEYHTPMKPYFVYRADNYPTQEQQWIFLKAYLSEMGQEITEQVLEKMCLEAEIYSLTSHLLMVFWSIICRDNCKAKLEFLEFADCRLDVYFALKKRLGL